MYLDIYNLFCGSKHTIFILVIKQVSFFPKKLTSLLSIIDSNDDVISLRD